MQTHQMNKTIGIILELLLCFNFVSCNYIKSQKKLSTTERQIQKYQKNTIILPDTLQVLINDTIKYLYNTDIHSYRLKIVTVFNDSDCYKCYYLKFNSLKHFTEKLTSFEHVILIVFFCGSSEYFKRIVYPEIAFSSPVILDRKCVFISRNKLPDSEEYNTLLLDENNKVLLIGDPTQNAETERLYINKISELK